MKTKAEKASVKGFLDGVEPTRRDDCDALIAMMSAVTRADPVMWGPAIIGFGQRRLVYGSGRELDWFQLGFSPRKGQLSLYLMGLEASHPDLKSLGKHTLTKGCLYVKRLSDIDSAVLRSLMETVTGTEPLIAPRSARSKRPRGTAGKRRALRSRAAS
jgi:hypothetical protein